MDFFRVVMCGFLAFDDAVGGAGVDSLVILRFLVRLVFFSVNFFRLRCLMVDVDSVVAVFRELCCWFGGLSIWDDCCMDWIDGWSVLSLNDSSVTGPNNISSVIIRILVGFGESACIFPSRRHVLILSFFRNRGPAGRKCPGVRPSRHSVSLVVSSFSSGLW